MARLTVKDLIEKKDKCAGRFATKKTLIHSKFLDGEIEFHSLSREDLADSRERLKANPEKGLLYFIYISSEDLSQTELLKAYKCDKIDNYKIVEILFSEAEISEIIGILEKLNGLTLDPDAIYEMQVEDLKN